MKLPRIKPMHNPVRLSKTRIRIGTLHYGIGCEIQDEEDGNIWLLLKLMDGTRGIKDIIIEVQKVNPKLDTESIYQAIDVIITSGFVEDAAALPPSEFTLDEIERHSRSTNYFGLIDIKPRASRYEIQRRLKHAHVTILGLGGTGSAIAMSLAATGIGFLHILDFDRVEVSNLNRQLLYTEDDIGLPKVERAVERLRRINSQITVTGQELQVKSSNDLVPLMTDCDLFILCADTPVEEIQHWTNDAALFTCTPWSLSCYAGLILFTGIFLPFQTPCYECFVHSEAQKSEVRDGGKAQSLLNIPAVNSAIAPTASLTGHLTALEAIYFLGDLSPQTVGRIFHQNKLIYDNSYYIEPQFWTECPACGSNSPYQPT